MVKAEAGQKIFNFMLIITNVAHQKEANNLGNFVRETYWNQQTLKNGHGKKMYHIIIIPKYASKQFGLISSQ